MSSLICSFLFVSSAIAPPTTFVCTSRHHQEKKTVCTVLIERGAGSEAVAAAHVLAKDLTLSDYCEVQIKENQNPFSDQMCRQLFDESADFVCSVSQKNSSLLKKIFSSSAPEIEIVAARACDGKQIFSTSCSADPVNRTYAVHGAADQLLALMVGAKSCFNSTLAWCQGSEIILSDPLGIVCKSILGGKSLVFAPTWHFKEPILYFSQTAESRHVLKSIHLFSGEQQLCVDQKGLNMQLAYNESGDKSLLVMSGGKGNAELFLSEKDLATGHQVTRALTHNKGSNSSPLFLKNGDIAFCSDFETNSPQLYYLFAETKRVVRLTSGGYCAAPSYCSALHALIYTKPKNGIFQLYMLSLKDFDGKKMPDEVQLTFGGGNKTDPVWHPQGRMIAFVYEFINPAGVKEIQIALLNRHSRKISVVTHGEQRKSFPAWIDKPWWHGKA